MTEQTKVAEYDVIEETDSYYLVKDDDGKKIKLFKIKQEELEAIHREQNLKIAEKLTGRRLVNLSEMLKTLAKTDVFVEQYKGVAEGLVKDLKICYHEVGSPNLFHHYIKNLDPEVYGRAETFRSETKDLQNRIQKIVEFKKGL